MVKPQFEVGRERLGKGGVVRSPELHRTAIQAVVDAAERERWFAHAVVPSRLPGPAGNREFFAAVPDRSSGPARRPRRGRRVIAPAYAVAGDALRRRLWRSAGRGPDPPRPPRSRRDRHPAGQQAACRGHRLAPLPADDLEALDSRLSGSGAEPLTIADVDRPGVATSS